MSRLLRIEWLFAVLLVLPVSLFAAGNLFGIDVLREAAGYLMLPAAAIVIFAFVANFVDATRRDQGRKAKALELDQLLASLVDMPEAKLVGQRLDGTEISAAFVGKEYLITDKQQTSVISRVALNKEILQSCVSWKLSNVAK